jgi:hypothetical protein
MRAAPPSVNEYATTKRPPDNAATAGSPSILASPFGVSAKAAPLAVPEASRSWAHRPAPAPPAVVSLPCQTATKPPVDRVASDGLAAQAVLAAPTLMSSPNPGRSWVIPSTTV